MRVSSPLTRITQGATMSTKQVNIGIQAGTLQGAPWLGVRSASIAMGTTPARDIHENGEPLERISS